MKDIISHLRDGAAAVFSRPVDGLQSVSKREFLKTGVGTAALATLATLGVRTAHACNSPTCAKNKYGGPGDTVMVPMPSMNSDVDHAAKGSIPRTF